MSDRKICIRASYIVAYDGYRHRYIKNGELVFQDENIIFVGNKYAGPLDETIDARGKIVAPGFVNVHAHLSASPMDRSFLEDRGNPQFYYSGLYDSLSILWQAMDPGIQRICFEYSLAEQLRTGVTTVVELGAAPDDFVSTVADFGIRIYFAPMYASANWHVPDGKKVCYVWKEDGGRTGLEAAVRFIRENNGTHSNLVRAMLAPHAADTCTERLLMDSQEKAEELKVPITLHAGQSAIELQEMLRRNGKTTLCWLRDIGFLRQNVILGHGIIIGGTRWSLYPPGDLELLSESGASVAHSPWVFARRGIIMESFGRYLKDGVLMGLGTDTCPQNMLQAMRWAAALSKIADNNTLSVTAADVFDAATLGGAEMLGRKDLGRLCAGAKADITIFSGESMNMVPLRDPVKNIVYNAEMEDVETVIVNGRTVLQDGRLTTRNLDQLNRALQQAGEKMWRQLPACDKGGRTADDFSALTYDLLENDLET